VSPVKYELGFYIPEDDILHSKTSSLIYKTMILSALAKSSRESDSRSLPQKISGRLWSRGDVYYHAQNWCVSHPDESGTKFLRNVGSY
jgi:hypothetical protein